MEAGVTGARIEHTQFDAVRQAPMEVAQLRNPGGTFRNWASRAYAYTRVVRGSSSTDGPIAVPYRVHFDR